jgi:hypothetical protein
MLLTKQPFSNYLLLNNAAGRILNDCMVFPMVLYPFIAMKTVYRQSFGKTLVKFLIAGWSYSILLTIAFACTLIYAFVMS